MIPRKIPPMYMLNQGINFDFDWETELEIDPTSLKLIAGGISGQRYAIVIWIEKKEKEEKSSHSKFAQFRAKPGFSPYTDLDSEEWKKFGEHAVLAKLGATGIVHVQTIEKVEEQEEELRSDRYVRIGLSFQKFIELGKTKDKFELLNRSTQNNIIHKVHPLALALYGFDWSFGRPKYDSWFHLERSLPENLVIKISKAVEKQIGKYTQHETEVVVGNSSSIDYENGWKYLWEFPEEVRNKQIEKMFIKSLHVHLNDLSSAAYLEQSEEILKMGFQFAKDANIKIDLNCLPVGYMLYEYPPLLIAIKFEKWEMFHWLLASGADPNLKGSHPLTPLMELVKIRKTDLIKEILEYKANLDEVSLTQTALSIAVTKMDSESAGILLKYGADPNLKFDSPYVYSALHTADLNNDNAMFALLLHWKANPNEQLKNKDTFLCMAAQNGDKERVELLLQAKADPNLPGVDGKTALYWAVQFEYPEIAELLLKQSANPNVLTPSGGDTLLCLAAERGKTSLVELLLKFGADRNQAGKYGLIPLGCATNGAIISLLKSFVRIPKNVKEFKSSLAGSARFFPPSKAERVRGNETNLLLK